MLTKRNETPFTSILFGRQRGQQWISRKPSESKTVLNAMLYINIFLFNACSMTLLVAHVNRVLYVILIGIYTCEKTFAFRNTRWPRNHTRRPTETLQICKVPMYERNHVSVVNNRGRHWFIKKYIPYSYTFVFGKWKHTLCLRWCAVVTTGWWFWIFTHF